MGNTIDPLTKKQIVHPLRNEKCNHIYEKETIFPSIDMAKNNGKAVKCPYMGCNCKDFDKSDLVEAKEVLEYIGKLEIEKSNCEETKNNNHQETSSNLGEVDIIDIDVDEEK